MRIIFLILSLFFAGIARAELSAQEMLHLQSKFGQPQSNNNWKQNCREFSVRTFSGTNNSISRMVNGICPFLYAEDGSLEKPRQIVITDVKSSIQNIGKDIALGWLESLINDSIEATWKISEQHFRQQLTSNNIPRIKPHAHIGKKGIGLSFEINF